MSSLRSGYIHHLKRKALGPSCLLHFYVELLLSLVACFSLADGVRYSFYLERPAFEAEVAG